MQRAQRGTIVVTLEETTVMEEDTGGKNSQKEKQSCLLRMPGLEGMWNEEQAQGWEDRSKRKGPMTQTQ